MMTEHQVFHLKKSWHLQIDQFVLSTALFPYQVIFLLLGYLDFYRSIIAHHSTSKSGDEKRDICMCHGMQTYLQL